MSGDAKTIATVLADKQACNTRKNEHGGMQFLSSDMQL
jgi:hypothetical protein